MKKKVKRKIKWQNIILIFLLILSLIGLNYSLYKIVKWNIDANNTNEQITEIQESVEIVETIDNDNTEIIEQTDETITEDKENPYWDYIKMRLIDVDFTELKLVNNETKGWIQVNGTNINYPFVQASDNSYYLTHSFDKSINEAGWVFLDYRNDLVSDKNTIIYAHARLDKTMFGSLKNIFTSSWLNNTDNYVVKISTETENTLWQVFSIYKIPTTNDYIQTSFSNDDEFLSFVNMLINRSEHNFNTTVSKDDRILTLSTCSSNNKKAVLHAKLIKREVK